MMPHFSPQIFVPAHPHGVTLNSKMNLAKILIVYVFLTPLAQSGAQPSPQPQTSQSAPSPSTASQTSTPPAAPQPSVKRTHHKKKTSQANCSTAPTTGGPSPAPAAEAARTSSTNLPPCPTPKKVVRNGGSVEPSIQLVGGGTSAQNEQQRTIDQLTAATKENLKKLEGRQLNPTEQDTVSQIKQFMDQSKTAAAAGDLERGNNLAMKARLLSDELVKP
jgi:hypothetical protein